VADFFGSPSMNLIAGTVAREGDRARFQAPGLAVELPPSLARAAAGAGTLGFRPEHLAVSQNGGIFRGEVRLVEPLGKDTLLYFDRSGDQPLIAVVDGTRTYREGDTLGVSVDPERLYLFGEDGRRVR
jgi:ABC-type sugar transport system ATPase subunit